MDRQKDQIKSELPLEAKMNKLRLLYLRHITRRQDSLKKTRMLGKVEGSRKRGISNERYMDSIKEDRTLSMQIKLFKPRALQVEQVVLDYNQPHTVGNDGSCNQ